MHGAPIFWILQTFQNGSQRQDDKSACQQVKVVGRKEAHAWLQVSDDAEYAEQGGDYPGYNFWCIGFHNTCFDLKNWFLALKIGKTSQKTMYEHQSLMIT